MKIVKSINDLYNCIMDSRMQTVITKRGQTVVPAPIRKRYAIEEGDRLVWIDDGQVIKVIPVPSDPIRALRGRGKGENLLEALLKSRQEDRLRE
jgi:AbrB family looped-hinge helix DNA binding protein